MVLEERATSFTSKTSSFIIKFSDGNKGIRHDDSELDNASNTPPVTAADNLDIEPSQSVVQPSNTTDPIP